MSRVLIKLGYHQAPIRTLGPTEREPIVGTDYGIEDSGICGPIPEGL